MHPAIIACGDSYSAYVDSAEDWKAAQNFEASVSAVGVHVLAAADRLILTEGCRRPRRRRAQQTLWVRARWLPRCRVPPLFWSPAHSRVAGRLLTVHTHTNLRIAPRGGDHSCPAVTQPSDSGENSSSQTSFGEAAPLVDDARFYSLRQQSHWGLLHSRAQLFMRHRSPFRRAG